MESVLADTAAVENTEADAEVVATDAEGSAPSAPKAGTSEDTSSWTEKAQKRYDELTRKAYEAQGERDRERYQREALQAELAELKKAKTEPVAPENVPTLEQFGYDEGKFNTAVAAHFTKVATEQGKAAAQEAIDGWKRSQQQEQANKNWATKETEFLKSKPDYVDKVIEGGRRGAWACTNEMTDVITRSDQGPAIAYYLAENADKAAVIARMSPLDQARELGRIEAKLEAVKLPPKPLVSQAPPPVAKVDANEAVVEKSPTDMSDAEFAKWRRRQIAQRR